MIDRYDHTETVVINGFAIVEADGRVWLDQVFADEDGANMTAARCCKADCTIRPAREVRWLDYRPGYKLPVPRRQVILGDEAA